MLEWYESKSDSLQSFLDCFYYWGWSWNYCLLQFFSIRHRDVNCCYSFDWSIKIVKSFSLVNDCCDLGSNSTLRESVFNGDKSISFHNTFDNTVSIKRLDSSKVDNLTRNVFFCKFLSSLQSIVYVSWITDQSNMFSFSHNLCFANRGHKIFIKSLIANLESLSIEILIL